jgi:hypothetical protein
MDIPSYEILVNTVAPGFTVTKTAERLIVGIER